MGIDPEQSVPRFEKKIRSTTTTQAVMTKKSVWSARAAILLLSTTPYVLINKCSADANSKPARDKNSKKAKATLTLAPWHITKFSRTYITCNDLIDELSRSLT